MKYYETRIFNKQGRTSLIFHQLHFDDRAAIQAAKTLAGDQEFDLWRGMDCIYATGVNSGQKLQ